MMKELTDYSQIGLYTGAQNIVNLLTQVQTVFSTFWVPVAFEHFSKNPEDKDFYIRVNKIVSCGMLLIFVLIRRRLRRRRYRQLDARERLLMQETEIRELLGKLDPEPVNPVLTDYAARLPDPALSADLRAFTDNYEAVRFGAKSVLPAWTLQAEKLRAALAERWIAADPDSTVRKWIRRAQIRISRRTFEEE